MILFVIANNLTASASAILLQYTAPAWAALFGWLLLRERPRWEHWCALVLVCGGLFLVFSSGLAKGSLLGDTLALISGITFGLNSVVLRLKKDGNPADIFIFAHIICVLFSLPFFFLPPPVINAGNILSILFMGIFQSGTASALFAYGIKRVPAVQAMLTAAIEPVLNPVWVLAVTGEKPSLSVLAGGSLIIVAVLFTALIRYMPRLRCFKK
jgi:drug/metabolite transporter (DMT)-like permease